MKTQPDFTQPFQVKNSRGKILLEVLSSTATIGDGAYGSKCFHNMTYLYKGEGIGGNVSLAGLHNTIQTIKLDCPSAKVTGFLPNPTIL